MEDAQAPAAHSCKVVLFVKFLARFSHYFHTKHSRFIARFFLKRVTKGLKRIKNATSRFSARRPLLSALFPRSCQHIRITNCADISLDTKELSEHEKKGTAQIYAGALSYRTEMNENQKLPENALINLLKALALLWKMASSHVEHTRFVASELNQGNPPTPTPANPLMYQ